MIPWPSQPRTFNNPIQPPGGQMPGMSSPWNGGGGNMTPWAPPSGPASLPGNAPIAQAPGPGIGSQNLGGAPGGNTGSFNTQYATTNNLNPYMSGWGGSPYQYQGPGEFRPESDPGFEFAKQQAINAIQNSASARGMLGSTGTMNDIVDRINGLSWQHVNDAFGRYANQRDFGRDTYRDDRNFYAGDVGQARDSFFGDRNYMTDVFRDNRNFNYGGYRDQVGDFNQRLQNWFNQNQGLVDTQSRASGAGAALPLGYAQTLADLFSGRGDARSAGRIGRYNSQAGFANSLLGFIPSLLELGG